MSECGTYCPGTPEQRAAAIAAWIMRGLDIAVEHEQELLRAYRRWFERDRWYMPWSVEILNP